MTSKSPTGPNPHLREMLDFNIDDYIREETRNLGDVPSSSSSKAYIICFEGGKTTKVAKWDHDNEVWVPIGGN